MADQPEKIVLTAPPWVAQRRQRPAGGSGVMPTPRRAAAGLARHLLEVARKMTGAGWGGILLLSPDGEVIEHTLSGVPPDGSAQVGRLAVSIKEQPDIFPINFVVDHGTVVFRTAEGTKLAAAVLGPVDRACRCLWSLHRTLAPGLRSRPVLPDWSYRADRFGREERDPYCRVRED